MSNKPIIERGPNPYSFEVQGKANEPICVDMLLARANKEFGLSVEHSLDEIVERMERNAPRIAIIAGSSDHPAHVMDYQTVLQAAVSIWRQGGVPFSFGVPVICDGTAQSHIGMSYSLLSRNLVTDMVENQMEGQAYHGAFVLQGCDKTPLAVVAALANLDRVRQARGDAPVMATFAPAHVLRGGTYPPDLERELTEFAQKADQAGAGSLGDDVRLALNHILQCTTNQAFQGVFERGIQLGILSQEQRKTWEKRLAVQTCHPQGGVCAFNGTGNSSRHAVAALGLVHPALEFLTQPATQTQIDAATAALFAVANDPDYSVSSIVRRNIENCIRIHSSMAGSTNLMMHIVAAMVNAGVPFTLADYEKIRTAVRVPQLIDYSLTHGRDIFVLAQQYESGHTAGVASVLASLADLGVPVREEAPTMAGATWASRLQNARALRGKSGELTRPVLRNEPVRPDSGVDALRGNFFESAVVKISGMPPEQLDAFDGKVAAVLYFESEAQAVEQLLNVRIIEDMQEKCPLSRSVLLAMHKANGGSDDGLSDAANEMAIINGMLMRDTFRLAVVIAGQGPAAFGMPEMFTPMHNINHNASLKKIAAIISDGRYSGVSYGAAIGHVTPEAYHGGGILYLTTGDLLHVLLRRRRIDLLDRETFAAGQMTTHSGNLETQRKELGRRRRNTMESRRDMVVPSNRMEHYTDASKGVVPLATWEWAARQSAATEV